jgi:hypothetical protein
MTHFTYSSEGMKKIMTVQMAAVFEGILLTWNYYASMIKQAE